MSPGSSRRLPSTLVPVVQALEPILADALVVGGWAHRLHRQHPLAMELDEEPVQTMDCDVALGLKASAPLGLDLASRFDRAGFDFEHTGTELQESGVFRSRADPTFTVQLLVPRRGSGTTRTGDPIRTRRVGGVPVEVLRGLDLLEIEPWRAAWVVGPESQVDLSVCHPIPFVLAKLVLACVASRALEDRAKDLIYVLDTVRLFDGREEALLREVPSLALRVGPSHRREIQTAHAEILRPESHVAQFAQRLLEEIRGERSQESRNLIQAVRAGLAPALETLASRPS